MKRTKQTQSEALIGRTISGVISKPVAGGRESVVMLQFSDGSCFEFVSPRSAKVLSKITRLATHCATESNVPPQLSMFPPDGVKPLEPATHLAA